MNFDDHAHLRPGFVRPSLSRPPKQRWANWVRDWKPESGIGKAAKAYSYASGGTDRYNGSAEKAYRAWLEQPLEQRQAAEAAARERLNWAQKPAAVPVVKRRAGRKIGSVAGVAAVPPELTAALARIAELETQLAASEAATRRFGLVRRALEALAA